MAPRLLANLIGLCTSLPSAIAPAGWACIRAPIGGANPVAFSPSGPLLDAVALVCRALHRKQPPVLVARLDGPGV